MFALLVDSNLFCEFEIVDSLDCVLALLVDINSICVFVNLMSNILRLNFVFFFLVSKLSAEEIKLEIVMFFLVAELWLSALLGFVCYRL